MSKQRVPRFLRNFKPDITVDAPTRGEFDTVKGKVSALETNDTKQDGEISDLDSRVTTLEP